MSGNMRSYNFCPSCKYLIWGQNYGINYCPHCGTQLFWELEKAKNHHKEIFDSYVKYFEALKNNLESIKNNERMDNK